MKRKLLLCCVLILILLFSGCNKNTEETTTELLTTTTTEFAESTTIPTTVVAATETTTVKYLTETTTEATTETEKTTSETTQTVTETVTEEINYCTLEIDCSTILKNEKKLSKSAKDRAPSDGIILESTRIQLEDGDTVLNVLLRAAEEKRIEVDYTDMPMFNSCYIEGINGLFEKDCGSASGWMYSVNGEFPQVGANAYTVSAGDEITFIYTCDGGMDIGDR